MIKLNNGIDMPQLGLGTWLHNNLEEVLTHSLPLGYRYIDTGRVYGNEKHIGTFLKTQIDKG